MTKPTNKKRIKAKRQKSCDIEDALVRRENNLTGEANKASKVKKRRKTELIPLKKLNRSRVGQKLDTCPN